MASGLLSGKRGIVFGIANNKSLAWACAQACAAEGASLVFNFLGAAQEKRLNELMTEIPGGKAKNCDLGKDDELEEFFKWVRAEWDSIDFVIHAVAYTDKECLKEPFVNTSRQQFLSTMDISAFTLVAAAKHAAPLMRNGGSIISMSYYGAEKVVPNYNVMGVAKAALEACTRYLAEDLGPQGIRVNTISAGPIRTLSASAIPGLRNMLDYSQKFSPLRRNITGEDVARSALFLLSDLGSGVTGENLHVDCGYHAMGMFREGTAPANEAH
ncbi:enoyl-ACP reductase [bacterium]|nr:enoyl-ACP reductase [bacterium]